MAFKRLELQRRRKTVGFTQETFAEKLNVDRSTVARWERGTSEPSAYIRPKMARALDISLEQLSAIIEPSGPVGAGRTSDPPDVPVHDSQVVDDVNRRKMLKALGVGAAAISSPGKMIPSPTNDRIGRVGKGEVDALFAHTARLRRLDNYLGGADTYRLYFSELEKTVKLAREATCSSTTRKSLTCMVAEQAQMAGWAAFDAGMHEKARKH